MKKSTYLLSLVLILMLIMSMSGCKSESEASASLVIEEHNATVTLPDKTDTSAETTSGNVKSDGYDKFSQLKIGMTESEVNTILGDPTSVDKAYYYYNIIVNGQDLELTVWINTGTGLVTNIYGDFYSEEYRAEFADNETDLSTVDGLENGEISTYDACVNAFKTPGYLISIDEDGIEQYLWVNANDGHMTVTFKDDGSVKTYQGVC